MRYVAKRVMLIALLSLLSGLGIPAVGSADTLTVTGGTWTVLADGGGTFTLTGSNFSGNGFTTDPWSLFGLFANPGGPVAAQNSHSGVSGAPHSFVVDGTTYPVNIWSPSSIALHVATAPFTAPSDFAPTFPGIGVETPALLTGSLNLCASATSCVNHILDGQGTAGFNFVSVGPPWEYIQNTRAFTVTFSNPAEEGGGTAPVPEPASLLLFGSGLAGLMRRKFRSQV